ncbi:MAG TPA: hypothetical protein DIU15_17280, partial [Deltaproteobacteria bacterium]|nr:hypothetical protein [Deltaproteobacteria bacterium]
GDDDDSAGGGLAAGDQSCTEDADCATGVCWDFSDYDAFCFGTMCSDFCAVDLDCELLFQALGA